MGDADLLSCTLAGRRLAITGGSPPTIVVETERPLRLGAATPLALSETHFAVAGWERKARSAASVEVFYAGTAMRGGIRSSVWIVGPFEFVPAAAPTITWFTEAGHIVESFESPPLTRRALRRTGVEYAPLD